MSRNFELLRRMQKDHCVLDMSPHVPMDQAVHAATGASAWALPSQVDPQIAALVQRLFILPGQESARVVIFAEVEPGSSNNLCAQAADALSAESRGAVCMLDANFENPSAHAYFDISNERGFAKALSEPGNIERFAVAIGGRNLAVIPTGSIDGSSLPAQGDGMLGRMAELRSRFHYVLVSAPPLMSSHHAVLLGQVSDGLVMVLEAHNTRRVAAQSAKQQCLNANVQVLGAVLHNRTFPIPHALYSRL
jgi:Mrp family chromosome partitioning ATPase